MPRRSASSIQLQTKLAERDITKSLASIYAPTEPNVVCTLPSWDAIEYLMFASGRVSWLVTAPGSWPWDLAPAPSGPDQVNHWFAER